MFYQCLTQRYFFPWSDIIPLCLFHRQKPPIYEQNCPSHFIPCWKLSWNYERNKFLENYLCQLARFDKSVSFKKRILNFFVIVLQYFPMKEKPISWKQWKFLLLKENNNAHYPPTDILFGNAFSPLERIVLNSTWGQLSPPPRQSISIYNVSLSSPEEITNKSQHTMSKHLRSLNH